jgi:hypothetical protein
VGECCQAKAAENQGQRQQDLQPVAVGGPGAKGETGDRRGGGERDADERRHCLQVRGQLVAEGFVLLQGDVGGPRCPRTAGRRIAVVHGIMFAY